MEFTPEQITELISEIGNMSKNSRLSWLIFRHLHCKYMKLFQNFCLFLSVN